MSTEDSTLSLSPTQRLNRWGAAKPASPETALRPSIAAARRKSVAVPDPASGPSVSNLLLSDSVETSFPAPLETTMPAVSPSADAATSLQAELGKLGAKLESIAASVEFTEAYVSAGITRSIGDILVKEVGAAERFAAIKARYRWQQRVWALLVLALVGVLAAEVRFDFLESLVDEVMLQAEIVLGYGLAAAQWIVATVSAWLR